MNQGSWMLYNIFENESFSLKDCLNMLASSLSFSSSKWTVPWRPVCLEECDLGNFESAQLASVNLLLG